MYVVSVVVGGLPGESDRVRRRLDYSDVVRSVTTAR